MEEFIFWLEALGKLNGDRLTEEQRNRIEKTILEGVRASLSSMGESDQAILLTYFRS